jgi:N-acetylneuraminate synthase/sialic acid synthase
MQCTSSYPCAPKDLDLGVIPKWKQRYPNANIGYSGHDNTIAMPFAAYVLGATVIEKHFTLDRSMKGTDNIFSLNPDGMRRLVRDINRFREARGDKKRIHDSEEEPMRKMRKALVARTDLPEGHRLSGQDIETRVADGLSPYHREALWGRTLAKQIKRHESFTWAHVRPEWENNSPDRGQGNIRNIVDALPGGKRG